MNATAVNNQIAGLPQMRMKAMLIGTKLRTWLQVLNNDERGYFYNAAGDLFTHHNLPANIIQRLVSADIGSLEDFAENISGNMALYMYFSELTYAI
jgi:hypothetical protein